jgi:protein O-GlcNAc transferase
MKDDAADAIPELETAEKLDPSASEPPYVLGVLYMQAGRYADKPGVLNTTLKLRPENGVGWATLGSVDNHLERPPEAEAALKETIRQLHQQPDPHLTLAAVLAKENQLAETTAERKIGAGLMSANMNRQRSSRQQL